MMPFGDKDVARGLASKPQDKNKYQTGNHHLDITDTSEDQKTSIRKPLVKLENVSVTFGHLEALQHITLNLQRNEILAVVGDNGAGKSTLLKVLCGVYQPDPGGKIYLNDRVIHLGSIRDAKHYGIVSVFQNQEFCPNLDVTQNLYLGRELHNRFGLLQNKIMESNARKVLLNMAAPLGLHKRISTLTRGQEQMLAISKTLLDYPNILLLDEPTASLSVIQTAQVLRYIKQLRNKGKTILFICNSLPGVFAIADHILVLRQGKVAAVQHVTHTSYRQVISLIAGVETDSTEAQQLGDAYKAMSDHYMSRLNREDDSALTPGEEETNVNDNAL